MSKVIEGRTIGNRYWDLSCPACAYQWSDECDLDVSVGAETECPNCHITLVIDDQELTFSLSRKDPPDA